VSDGFFFKHPETKDELVLTNIHLMVDIETMGTAIDSPVITICAVLFDPRQQDDVSVLQRRGFLRRVDVKDAVDHSAGIDGDTLRFWLNQKDEAIKALVGTDSVPLKTALEDLRQYAVHRWPKSDDKFFAGHSQFPVSCLVWANSPDFDCKILEHAFQRVEDMFPFRFFQFRCLRTLKDLAWPNGPDSIPKFATGAKHDAMADAVNQALIVQAGYKALGLSAQDVSYTTF
jgi:hypothetical protein